MGDAPSGPPPSGHDSNDSAEPAPASSGEGFRDSERLTGLDRVIPEIIRRLVEKVVETGVETIVEGPENIKKVVGDLKLPKDAAQYVFHQVDDTKKGVYRAVAKEIRDVLEHTNFADEIAEVLTKLSFEVNTQIRFVPNEVDERAAKDESEPTDDAEDEALAKRPSRFPSPRVVSKVVMKAKEQFEKHQAGKRKSSAPTDE